MILEYVITILIGYLLGSINSSIVVSKVIYGKDIRNYGSGNAGATNTLRTFGKGAVVLVLLGDILKGVISVLAANQISGNLGILLGGIFCIIGHNWPIYFNFKGGKGILTSIAIVITIDWRIGLILLGVGVLIIALTRYVSLGSLIGCITFPILTYYMPNLRGIDKYEFLIFSLIVSILAIVRHRSNILRLIRGTESKLGHNSSLKNI